jgi:hypothetical protein
MKTSAQVREYIASVPKQIDATTTTKTIVCDRIVLDGRENNWGIPIGKKGEDFTISVTEKRWKDGQWFSEYVLKAEQPIELNFGRGSYRPYKQVSPTHIEITLPSGNCAPICVRVQSVGYTKLNYFNFK